MVHMDMHTGMRKGNRLLDFSILVLVFDYHHNLIDYLVC